MNPCRHDERDFVGYGAKPPHANWPGGARIAVQFVVNYEEGGENCVLDGDSHSENFLSEVIGAPPFEGVRHLNIESIYEYGARAGFWRLWRLFGGAQTPLTVFGVGAALLKNPDAVAAMQEAKWEIACHGHRWHDFSFANEEAERRHLQNAVAAHTQAVGEPPQGWYIGRTSPNTRRLLLEMGDWLYDSDSYADDLPYWVLHGEGGGRAHLVVPYTLDANDMRFATAQGFNSGAQFYEYLKDAFDTLYDEGAEEPKMLSVGLHCRLAGRPGRAAAVARFLEYINGKSGVWICRRADIARHWHAAHPPQTATSAQTTQTTKETTP